MKVSSDFWFQEKVRTTGKIPVFLVYLWGLHSTAGNPAGITVLDMGSIYSTGKGSVLFVCSECHWGQSYCQSYPSLGRQRHVNYLLAWLVCKNPFLNLCVWEETLGRYFKCWDLGRLFHGYQKQSDQRHRQFSAQPVCAYRKGRRGDLILV